MTSRRIAQTNQPQKSDAGQVSSQLQRTSVRSVPGGEVLSSEDTELQAFSNSPKTKDFSQVPIRTMAQPQIMTKLTIGEAGNKYEQEADRVAVQVVRQINTPASAQSTQGQSVQHQEERSEEVQEKPSNSDLQQPPLSPEVQREAMTEEEDIQAKSILHRREAIAGGEASTDLASAINRARGSGQPLNADLQRSMGQVMRADFSGVKVHTDTQSDQLNQSIQAKAFTTGQDVFFRQGEYNPGSRGGQELIAHELTHVVQQSSKHNKISPTNKVVQRELATIKLSNSKKKRARKTGPVPVLKGRRSKGLNNKGFINKTKVTFTTGTLPPTLVRPPLYAGGEEVGLKMEGIIGPDHPAGSKPDSAAHEKAFNYLQDRYNKTYVRGHLLNGDLGGPGTKENLYPINLQANSHHYQYVERPIKEWVNVHHLYVYYKVEVNTNTGSTEPLDADFDCVAYPLNKDLPQGQNPGHFNTSRTDKAVGSEIIEKKIKSRAGQVSGTTDIAKVYAPGNAQKELTSNVEDKDIEYQIGKVRKGYIPIKDSQVDILQDISELINQNHKRKNPWDDKLKKLNISGNKKLEYLNNVMNNVMDGEDIQLHAVKRTWNQLAKQVNKANLQTIYTELQDIKNPTKHTANAERDERAAKRPKE